MTPNEKLSYENSSELIFPRLVLPFPRPTFFIFSISSLHLKYDASVLSLQIWEMNINNLSLTPLFKYSNASLFNAFIFYLELGFHPPFSLFKLSFSLTFLCSDALLSLLFFYLFPCCAFSLLPVSYIFTGWLCLMAFYLIIRSYHYLLRIIVFLL